MLIKDIVRVEPLNVTVSPARKPLPLIDNCCAGDPAVMGLGASEVIEGGASVALMDSSMLVRVWFAVLFGLVATIVIGHESSMLLLIKLQ